jgi:predicted transposase YbfD/YdcC
MEETTISRVFGDLEDPRCTDRVRHPLISILTISICAIISGSNNFELISEFGNSKKKWFSEFLDLPFGIPSPDTFNDVLNRLDPRKFGEAFSRWVNEIAVNREDIINIDGKTMRGTLDRAKGNPAIHLVSAWSHKNSMCFGQIRVSDKSNEISAIPELVDLLDLKGATVTIDAMGCQYEIGDQICKKGGDYLFSLKGNQGNLHDDVKTFFEGNMNVGGKDRNVDYHCSVSGDHGRIEQRHVYYATDTDWLIERNPLWKTINGIIAVRSVIETKNSDNSCRTETRYFVTSCHGENASAESIGTYVRAHWGVENNLHWQLDVTFKDDANRMRSGNAAENFSLLNKIALNLLKQEQSGRRSINTKRHKAGWDEQYLAKVLTSGLPSA